VSAEVAAAARHVVRAPVTAARTSTWPPPWAR